MAAPPCAMASYLARRLYLRSRRGKRAPLLLYDLAHGQWTLLSRYNFVSIFLSFFRLRSDDDNNFYIVECSQDAIQRERHVTQEMLSEQLAERDRLAEERTQRILEEERADNNAQTKAIYDLFSVSYYFCIYPPRMHMHMFGSLANMLESSKTNSHSMWEKQGLTPPPMPTSIVSPPGTVSFFQ